MARPQDKRSSQLLSDEELEYFAELYLGHGLRNAGVDFETFLGNPDYYLVKYPKRDERRGAQNDGNGRRGLRQFFGLRSASRTPSG
jgi:hypothetical protein